MSKIFDLNKLIARGREQYVGGGVLREIPPQTKPRDKYIVIKQNGRQKRYRINKYGELFEE